MIILRSIPLSFSVFWRFLVVMPLFVPLAGLVVLAFSLVFPFLAGLFAQIATTFAVMLALRGAYQARGVSGASVFGKLFGAALKWAGFELVVYLVIGIGIALALWLSAQLDMEGAIALLETPSLGGIWAFFAASPFSSTVAVIGIAVLYGLSIGFLVPKAAAGYSAGADAPGFDFFEGFGVSFLSLAVVAVASYAVSYLSGAAAGSVALVELAVNGLTSWWTGLRMEAPQQAALIKLALLVLVQIWSFCWLYAAAALAFLNHLGRIESVREAESIVPRTDPDELRALRKARQPDP